jgi:hypothetical protein
MTDRLFDVPLSQREPPAHGPGCHRLEHARSWRDGGPRYVCVPGAHAPCGLLPRTPG